MSTFSEKFDNHWKCIPYAMATLTSSDGFMILFHLLRRGYTDGDKTTCAISNKELADVMGTSISSVRRAIDTLKQLNLISCSQNKGALCTFYVNWSEIRAIHKVSSQISVEKEREISGRNFIIKEMSRCSVTTGSIRECINSVCKK